MDIYFSERPPADKTYVESGAQSLPPLRQPKVQIEPKMCRFSIFQPSTLLSSLENWSTTPKCQLWVCLTCRFLENGVQFSLYDSLCGENEPIHPNSRTSARLACRDSWLEACWVCLRGLVFLSSARLPHPTSASSCACLYSSWMLEAALTSWLQIEEICQYLVMKTKNNRLLYLSRFEGASDDCLLFLNVFCATVRNATNPLKCKHGVVWGGVVGGCSF